MKKALAVALVLVFGLVSISVAGAQDDPCTADAVVTSFAAATQNGETEAWLQRYADSECPPAIKEGAHALKALYESMGASEEATPVPPTPTPAVEAPVSDEAGLTGFPLLITRDEYGLLLINLAPGGLPLDPLRLGDGDSDSAVSGAEWEGDTLALRECVGVRREGGDVQAPAVECTVVGEQLTRDADNLLWQEAFNVYYHDAMMGTCEAGQAECFVIIPLPLPTPAPITPVIDCPGAPPSQLKLGGGARTAGGDREIFDAPAGAPIRTLLETAMFVVEGGPECVNNQVWWQVRTMNGTTGWISEGVGDEYHAVTCPMVAVADHGIDCPEANPSRLRVGQRRLISLVDGLRVRFEPRLSARIVDTLEYRELLLVTGAPACADGAIWWPVQSTRDRYAGWVAESLDSWLTVPEPWLGCQEE